MGAQCNFIFFPNITNIYLKNENEKINGGEGIGKPACKLHAESLNVLHSEGNLKMRN